jgi:hypothetical protein
MEDRWRMHLLMMKENSRLLIPGNVYGNTREKYGLRD